MKLVIHDLKEEEWKRISDRFGECKVISDTGSIRPCIGCFSCWAKTPGQCVVKDGYDEMGRFIHDADEVIVLSRYTYGGFSGFVKNVFDRCLGYVLPQFELVGGESHHKKRYDEDKAFTFIFYGNGMGPEERESAKRYVTAVCTNIRGYVKEVIFEENGEARKAEVLKVAPSSGKVLLLNGSMRSINGNTAALMKELKTQLKTECETAALRDHLKDLSGLMPAVEGSGSLVLCVPLYVDGLPAQTIRFMEMMEREYRGGKKKVYVLANMGAGS